MAAESYMRVFEESMVRNCAPTIAGMKPGSLFLCQERLCKGLGCVDESDQAAASGDPVYRTHCRMLGHALQECRSRFAPLGLNVEPMARRRNGTLIYVYRPEMLEELLADRRVADFLHALGYETDSVQRCLRRLRHRLRPENICGTGGASGAFPHEVGVFLGYPVDDVVGFMVNHGANYIASGCWKVYSNAEEAIECFGRYKTCTEQLVYRYGVGESLESLMSEEMFLKGALA